MPAAPASPAGDHAGFDRDRVREAHQAIERARGTEGLVRFSAAAGLVGSLPALLMFLETLPFDSGQRGVVGAVVAISDLSAFALLIAGGTICLVAARRIPGRIGPRAEPGIDSGLHLAIWGTAMLSAVAIVPVMAVVAAFATGAGWRDALGRVGCLGACGPVCVLPIYTLVACWLARARLRPALEILAEFESARRDPAPPGV